MNNVNTVKLVERLTSKTSNISNIKAVKYGREMEEARKFYSELLNKHHRNFSVSLSGIFIMADKVFLGASPDGLAHCDCCGSGLV